MHMEERFLQFIQLAAIAIIAVICYWILRPFIPAILFAIVVCISTWTLYLRLRRALWEKSTLAALVMILLLVLLVIVPSALLAVSLAYNVTGIVDAAMAFPGHGPIELPAWLRAIPVFGERLNDYWQGFAAGEAESVSFFAQFLEPSRNFLLGAARAIGESLLQMVFAAFIGFFLYRDGDALMKTLHSGLKKLAGILGDQLLITIQDTVAGVVHGIFGAALAQAIVAMIGFLVAGVPGAFLLGAATFFLSIIPIGPPLLWGGACIWLYSKGAYGWAIFMALWGVFVISSIDNLVRPYLISRGSKLSLLLIVIGMFGGIAAYGFIGIFIGPPILAVGLGVFGLWTARAVARTDTPR
jgi:predicted PurR-regulated permease PerM